MRRLPRDLIRVPAGPQRNAAPITANKGYRSHAVGCVVFHFGWERNNSAAAGPYSGGRNFGPAHKVGAGSVPPVCRRLYTACNGCVRLGGYVCKAQSMATTTCTRVCSYSCPVAITVAQPTQPLQRQRVAALKSARQVSITDMPGKLSRQVWHVSIASMF